MAESDLGQFYWVDLPPNAYQVSEPTNVEGYPMDRQALLMCGGTSFYVYRIGEFLKTASCFVTLLDCLYPPPTRKHNQVPAIYISNANHQSGGRFLSCTSFYKSRVTQHKDYVQAREKFLIFANRILGSYLFPTIPYPTNSVLVTKTSDLDRPGPTMLPRGFYSSWNEPPPKPDS